MLLGIDVGTTHCKAGLFEMDGTPLATVSLGTPRQADGTYDPETIWEVVKQVIGKATRDHDLRHMEGVGVASMAETGLLLDRATGKSRTALIAWHNRQAEDYVRILEDAGVERFARSGIHPTYKCALAKLLWLQACDSDLLENAIWLSTADYIVYRLTGAFITDYSLAGRTYAFDITARQWDTAWLASLGLPDDIFPDAEIAGTTFPANDEVFTAGTPVCIAGHDHVCAALAVGATQASSVLDSMGTAETLVGAWQAPGEREYESGLLFGCHVVPDQYYWMGSLSASGGSLEWLRGHLGGLSYEAAEEAMQDISDPTGILYFPYLAGSSGAMNAKAAFIGLEQRHQAGHLLKAVIEGTAYEIETIRRIAQNVLSIEISDMIAVGGGTRSAEWMQVKADVSNCTYRIFPNGEAALLGAAMLAGGTQFDLPHDMKIVTPDPAKHAVYRRLFEGGYLKLMQPLRDYYGRGADGRHISVRKNDSVNRYGSG